jgi:hypothetical protein
VVVVGLEGAAASAGAPVQRTVLLHDPARAPDVPTGEDAFLRSWEPSGRWMLLVRPRRGVTPAPVRPVEPAGAEPASPDLLRASERFRAGDWSAAASAAEGATRAAAANARAWRLLASALYLDDRPDDALDAWARVGEPRIDGVDVSGLVRTRHPVAHQQLGLHPGERLERTRLERARRRAGLLPTASLTRVGYRAEAGGWAEVEAVVLEGPAHPFTRRGALAALLGAASGELSAWESGLAGAGERLEARWRPGNDGGVRVELAAPGAFGRSGRTEVGVARLDESRHLAAWLRATDWAAGWLRWEAGARADRADGARVQPGVTGALHASVGGKLDARAGGAAWTGDGAAALAALDVSLVLGGAARAWTAEVRGGLRRVAGAVPSDLHPSAGSGGARALAAPFAGPDPMPLLRAHATVRGESVAHAGIQATRWTGSTVRVGVAAFVDAAVVREGALARRFADVGVGVRAGLAVVPGAVRLDHAWGWSDSDTRRWSLGWELPAGVRLAP